MSWWMITLCVAGFAGVGLVLYLGRRSARRKSSPDDIYPLW